MIDTQAIRSKIFDLAMRGQLTEQLPEDGNAEELYQQILEEKQKLIKDGKIKKQKPLPEISNEEIPFDIPANWKWVRLSDLVYLTSGNQYEEVLNGLPYVKVADMNLDVNAFEIITSSRFASPENIGRIPTSSIIFPKRGGAISTNKKRIVRTTEIYIDSNTMAMTMFFPSILLYAKIWFDSIDLASVQTGTSIPQINNKDIYPLLFPLPPLAEQKRIVEKIEQAFSILDTIDELQAQYADNLTVLKSKLIDAAIQGKLTEHLPEDGTAEEDLKEIEEKKMEIESSGVLKGRKKKKVLPLLNVNFPFEIPSSWKWIRLNSVVEIFGRIGFRGYTKNDIVERGQGAISLSPSNITKSGKITYENCTFLSWDKYNESPEIMVEKDDVILVKTGSSYGKCAIVKSLPEKATINPQLAILKYVLCDRNYLHTVLISDMAHKQYEEFVIGAATPTFSQENLANFLLPLPPLAEQKRIIQKLDEILPLCERLK